MHRPSVKMGRNGEWGKRYAAPRRPENNAASLLRRAIVSSLEDFHIHLISVRWSCIRREVVRRVNNILKCNQGSEEELWHAHNHLILIHWC